MDGLHLNVTDILDGDFKFSWHDYFLFFFMLIVSMGIGLYFGCTGKKQSTADEYLLGGKEIGVIPISMSLISSCISGITLLAVPADMYQYGALYGLGTISVPLGIWISYFVTVPVFVKLQLPSTFEYLKLRYNHKVRTFCSFLFTLSMVLYLPLVTYVPALALSQGTGFNIHYITPVICGVCIFYTTIGGLKAVVWTDAIQFVLMVGGTIICTYLGTASVGGISEVIKISRQGGRLDVDYDLDVTKRDTLWTGTLGVFFGWFVHICAGQGVIQKYIALPSMIHVKKTVIIFSIGIGAFIAASSINALVIYAKYNDCDPLTASKITKNDQLLPYLVLDVGRNIPGLPGVFIAGVFSAALSSLSGCMNCLSCTLYEDFISHRMPKDITQKKVSNILKLIVLVVGIVSTLLIYVVENLGGVLELSMSLGGITLGPQLGIFLMGMTMPSITSKGALYGGISSTLVLSWIIFGSLYYKRQGLLANKPLPTSTEGCIGILNATVTTLYKTEEWQPLFIYRISHYYYAFIGCLVVFTIGFIVSKCTKSEDASVHRDLISPQSSLTSLKMDEIIANVTNILHDDLKFSWHDYLLFSFTLLLSIFIGLYFGCTGKKQSTADEYLLGGKEMSVVPIAMSLITSYISGITILAVPSDIYQFGSSFGFITITIPITILIAYLTTIPVFMKLQLPSTYEYLKLRFCHKVRVFCSFLFAFSLVLYLPIVIYVPALALGQGTGFNIHYITPFICAICIFYTTIGGLKAVVWTDTIQFFLMIGSTLIFTYLGTSSVGGLGELTRISGEGGRLYVDYSLSLTNRDSFWTGSVAQLFVWCGHTAISQGCIQKCIALPTIQHVKKALIIFAIGMGLFVGCSVYAGLMIYSRYHDCDLLAAQVISKNDELLPYFVLDVARNVPGLPGLFIAGVFSAALSSLSGCMNCLSCTLYEDFISHKMPKDITQKKISNILKSISFSIGIISVALIYVVEHLGGILELSFSFAGITQGPLLGIFILGMMVPFANKKGALYGGIASTSIMSIIVLGTQYYKLKGFHYKALPTSTEGCGFVVNATTAPILEATINPPSIFQISHYYYATIGFFLVFAVGLPISWFTRDEEDFVDKDLISPVMQWAVRERKPAQIADYYTINQALDIMKQKVEVL